MDLKSILELLKAADKYGFDTFELNEKDFSFKLERNTGKEQVIVAAPQFAAAPMQAYEPQAPAPMAAPAAAPAVAPAQEAEAPVEQSKGKEISSPLVGVFHKLSGDKAVKIGTQLKQGDVVCMVEAMKLMNEITMPEDGEITWVACEEGDSVEYGQLLYNYK